MKKTIDGLADAGAVIDQVWRECLDPDPVRSLRTKADRLEAEAREYRAYVDRMLALQDQRIANLAAMINVLAAEVRRK